MPLRSRTRLPHRLLLRRRSPDSALAARPLEFSPGAGITLEMAMNETPSGINYDLMQAFSQVFGDKTDPVIQGAETNVLKLASMLTDPEQAALASSATGCVSMGLEVPNSITLQWRNFSQGVGLEALRPNDGRL